MARAGFVMPKAAKMTDAQRVDQIGLLKEQVKVLEGKLKRKGLVGKKVTGNLFQATIFGRKSVKVSKPKLLKLISEEQYESCLVRSKEESICLTVKRRKADE